MKLLLLCTTLSVLACGIPEPPLEQLNLRDALLADPAVIAGLPVESQQQLAGRFWTAMAAPGTMTQTAAMATGTPEQRLRRFDAQRQQHSQDAFLAGVWAQTGTTQTLVPLAPSMHGAPSAPLPPMLGGKSTLTKPQEARALAGRAGALIEDLRVRSGAPYLERVTAWPVAVVVVADRIYVNASWLIAVAALESEGSLPTNPSSGLWGTGVPAKGAVGRTELDDSAAAPGTASAVHPQALSESALDPEAAPTADPSATGSLGSCSSCSSCSSCNSSGCDSSSKTSSCNSDACVAAQDKQCCRACAIAPERRAPDLAPLWMMLWLSMPLVLLAGVDLRARVVTRRRPRA